MNNVVNIASAKPGTGKTESFIRAVDGSKNIVLAVPTKILSEDVRSRFEEKGIKLLLSTVKHTKVTLKDV
tara:strand:+ start:3439 stop:3648 length:210 start_codon:yes stop_codon:yes gene_type:complete